MVLEGISAIVVALCCVVIAYIGFLLVKFVVNAFLNSKNNGNATIKADLQNKSIELNIKKDIEKQNDVVNDVFSVKREIPIFKDRNKDSVVSYYSDLQFYDDITDWNIYKEFAYINSEAIFDIAYIIRDFISENGLNKVSKSDFLVLKQKRIDMLIEQYDLRLIKSRYKCLKELTLEKIAGYHYPIIRNLLEKCYNEIYENHNIGNDNIQKETKVLIENTITEMQKHIPKYEDKKELVNYIMQNILSILGTIGLNNIKHEKIIAKNDNSTSKNTLSLLNKMILGLFHDTIAYYYKQGG